MMFRYTISRLSHPDYGSAISIVRDDNGIFQEAWKAVQAASKEQRLWKAEGVKKVRFLIDDTIMTLNMAKNWAGTEYLDLPKCQTCAKPLQDQIFSHQLSQKQFCSQLCADQDYNQLTDSSLDEEEYECDFR
jgi:hypothetical protein